MANNSKQCFNTHYQSHCHPTTKSLWLCSSVYCRPPHQSRRIWLVAAATNQKYDKPLVTLHIAVPLQNASNLWTLLLTWISNYIRYKEWVELLIHFQTSPLKFGNWWVISSHTLLGRWLLIHARIKVNPRWCLWMLNQYFYTQRLWWTYLRPIKMYNMTVAMTTLADSTTAHTIRTVRTRISCSRWATSDSWWALQSGAVKQHANNVIAKQTHYAIMASLSLQDDVILT